MKVLAMAALALVLLTLESVWVRYAGMGIARVDVTVVLIAFLALKAGRAEGAVAAFVVGYLLDLMSGYPTGLYTFLGVLMFLLGRFGENLVDVRSPVAFAVFAMGVDALHGVLARFFSWMVSKGTPAVPSQIGSLLLQVALTGVAALVLFPILRRFEFEAGRPRAGMLG